MIVLQHIKTYQIFCKNLRLAQTTPRKPGCLKKGLMKNPENKLSTQLSFKGTLFPYTSLHKRLSYAGYLHKTEHLYTHIKQATTERSVPAPTCYVTVTTSAEVPVLRSRAYRARMAHDADSVWYVPVSAHPGRAENQAQHSSM